jgi:hypothetical protein
LSLLIGLADRAALRRSPADVGSNWGAFVVKADSAKFLQTTPGGFTAMTLQGGTAKGEFLPTRSTSAPQ